ncbi:hypothetical protein CO666_29950 [Rhizobium chutanense]|uniref:Uncharacterized protein n=1 Tax=Rhizobium chutanense TaxID=2035448 RepID=A0A2A6J3W0_9HYPH|nr:hypothetical protein CO666_29950 [Rhizobium chutanense]
MRIIETFNKMPIGVTLVDKIILGIGISVGPDAFHGRMPIIGPGTGSLQSSAVYLSKERYANNPTGVTVPFS